jgi:TolB-like protein/Flp pilus assembly protein TadD
MADIFISYSSKDREQAEQLTELLASAGLSVWIDKQGIGAATSWSGEISKAIEDCTALVLLLSPTSIESDNVRKEVSLAAERKKKILPLDLEPVTLPHDLAYHLAGIQRTSMANIDAIIRALGKIGLEATQAPTMKLVKETDSRKSLMILPFEDLSPSGDNGWFADGLTSELISALSNVKALRVTDPQATKEFKSFKGLLTTYAKEMSIRYFVQGDVRKFGDNIKITSRLLDVETGDFLWQDSLKGTMDDIFDIQEKVAENVVEGLKVHLASDERTMLGEHGTENAEAYELFLKAQEYFFRQTKDGYRLAVQLLSEAISLDPEYARAYYLKSYTLAQLYRTYDRTPALLGEAEILAKESLRIKPDTFPAYTPLAQIYMHRGEFDKAVEIAKELTQKDPLHFNSHFTLGFIYSSIGKYTEAIHSYKEAQRLNPGSLPTIYNLVGLCDRVGEKDLSAHWARVALPYYERYIKLNPDDEDKRVKYAIMLYMGGNSDEAYAEVMKLTNIKDGRSLYDIACLISKLGDAPEAVRTLRKAVEAGYQEIDQLKDFLADEKEGITVLAGTPDYEAVKQMVEKFEDEATLHG